MGSAQSKRDPSADDNFCKWQENDILQSGSTVAQW